MINSTPRKLSAAGIGLPVGIIITWAITTFTGIAVPAEVGAAIGSVCVFLASVLIPDARED